MRSAFRLTKTNHLLAYPPLKPMFRKAPKLAVKKFTSTRT